MSGLTISNKMLDKYFGYLKNLDDKTKKGLIGKLVKSMERKSKEKFEITTVFGAWEDDRSSDAIIDDIRASRVEKTDTEDWQ